VKIFRNHYLSTMISTMKGNKQRQAEILGSPLNHQALCNFSDTFDAKILLNIQDRGIAENSNVETLQECQSKILRMIITNY